MFAYICKTVPASLLIIPLFLPHKTVQFEKERSAQYPILLRQPQLQALLIAAITR